MALETAYEQWQNEPANLALLSDWVSEVQAQSRQQEAIERLAPIASDTQDKPVAAGIHAALVTLALDLGRVKQANEWVNRLDAAEPAGFRSPYFRGLILQRLGRLDEAISYFVEAVKRDKSRADSWNGLLDCCAKTRDLKRALRVVVEVRRLPWNSELRRLWCYRQGCIYQQMAKYSLALVCFSELILDCSANGIPQGIASKPRLSQVPPSAPLAALREAIELLEGQGLQPFPTAGTLLGWWREGKFLSHDKDIDILLPPGCDWEKGIATLSAAPAFAAVPSEMGYTNFRSFIHRDTRLVVDLSHHEAPADDGKVQCVWRIPGVPDEQCRRTEQTAYRLVRDQWLGFEFWRPDDTDRFLTELYGDWRTPMINFDTTISGHHVVGFPDVVRCYGYNRLANSLYAGNREKGLAYVTQILQKDPLDPVANHISTLMAQRGSKR